jgi:hypothetical protein
VQLPRSTACTKARIASNWSIGSRLPCAGAIAGDLPAVCRRPRARQHRVQFLEFGSSTDRWRRRRPNRRPLDSGFPIERPGPLVAMPVVVVDVSSVGEA